MRDTKDALEKMLQMLIEERQKLLTNVVANEIAINILESKISDLKKQD